MTTPMTPDIERVEYLGEYRLMLHFKDGKSGEVDLEDELWGPVFEPLRDVALFKQFRLHERGTTIEWPATGADLAPEFLYEQATQHPALRTDTSES